MKLITLVFITLATANTAQSEILKYTDNQGKTYFVDSAEKVPEPYKKQAEDKPNLPPISRLKAREYEKVTPSAESKRAKLEIYVTTWCPHCKRLENYLNSKNVQYTRYDIEKDSVGKAKYQQIGVRGVPIVKSGSTIVTGFDQSQIDELIGQ